MEEKMKSKIKITMEKNLLNRVGGSEYAEQWVGKTVNAEVKADGWAYVENAKFAPGTFSSEDYL